MSQIKSH